MTRSHPTIRMVNTPTGPLNDSLTDLALSLADALDTGLAVTARRRELLERWPAALPDPVIVDDLLLAASALLAGANPHLAGLSDAWGGMPLIDAATTAARLLRATPGTT